MTLDAAKWASGVTCFAKDDPHTFSQSDFASLAPQLNTATTPAQTMI